MSQTLSHDASSGEISTRVRHKLLRFDILTILGLLAIATLASVVHYREELHAIWQMYTAEVMGIIVSVGGPTIIFVYAIFFAKPESNSPSH